MDEINKVVEIIPDVIEKLNNISPFQKELKELKNKSLMVK